MDKENVMHTHIYTHTHTHAHTHTLTHSHTCTHTLTHSHTHTLTGILFSFKIEGNPVICNHMDEPGEHFA